MRRISKNKYSLGSFFTCHERHQQQVKMNKYSIKEISVTRWIRFGHVREIYYILISIKNEGPTLTLMS
jgi:hypothetical protein